MAAATIVSECRSSARLRLGLREHERLAGQHQRRQDHRPAAQAEDAEAGQHQQLQQQERDTAEEQQHFQPTGRAVQKIAPEEQHERQRGHERPDAHARRVQLDVNADETDHQQHHGQRRRRQRLDQLERPIRLRHARIVFESVKLLELVKAVDDVRRDIQLLRPLGGQPQRFAGRLDLRSLLPVVGIRLLVGFLWREVAHFAGLGVVVGEQLQIGIDHRRQQRPAVIRVLAQRIADG